MTHALLNIGGSGLTVAETVMALLVLDRSGSMGKYGRTPQISVNEYLDSLRTEACHSGKLYICGMVSFADTAVVEFPPTRVQELREYTCYNPGGKTRLYQTVDEVLNEALRHKKQLPPDEQARLRVVVGVFSDGDDNMSPLCYPKQLRDTSKKALDAGFELLVFGIGIKSSQLAANMGFPTENAEDFEPTEAGVRDSVISMTQSTIGGTYRPKN